MYIALLVATIFLFIFAESCWTHVATPFFSFHSLFFVSSPRHTLHWLDIHYVCGVNLADLSTKVWNELALCHGDPTCTSSKKISESESYQAAALRSSCNCLRLAHQSSDVGAKDLIEIGVPLTDNTGAIIAQYLTQPILLEKCGMGPGGEDRRTFGWFTISMCCGGENESLTRVSHGPFIMGTE